jgi:hypothetical protein
LIYCRVVAVLLQDGCSVVAGWLQSYCRVVAELLPDHCGIGPASCLNPDRTYFKPKRRPFFIQNAYTGTQIKLQNQIILPVSLKILPVWVRMGKCKFCSSRSIQLKINLLKNI